MGPGPGPVQISPSDEKEIVTMIIKDLFGNTAEVHLYDNDTGLDFVEEYLNAGSLDREAGGGCPLHYRLYHRCMQRQQPDFEEPLDAKWEYREL